MLSTEEDAGLLCADEEKPLQTLSLETLGVSDRPVSCQHLFLQTLDLFPALAGSLKTGFNVKGGGWT